MSCNTSACQVSMPMPSRQKICVFNRYNEKLVGLFHDTGSTQVVVLCHGFRSKKETKKLADISASLEKTGISSFRFDFPGNGESQGTLQFGNYWREVEDTRCVVEHFTGAGRKVSAIAGHSKGGNVALLYASKYRDISTVVNISGCYKLDFGLEELLGSDYLEKIKKEGFIDVNKCGGKVQYRVTEESLMDELNTDMHEACIQIDKTCRVLTVHGSCDQVVPPEDAVEFSKIIPNHKLHIVQGANHIYNSKLHHLELVSVVLRFIEEGIEEGMHHSELVSVVLPFIEEGIEEGMQQAK